MFRDGRPEGPAGWILACNGSSATDRDGVGGGDPGGELCGGGDAPVRNAQTHNVADSSSRDCHGQVLDDNRREVEVFGGDGGQDG